MIFYNKKEPAIYLRYCNNVVMYIGETQDWKRGRPFREGDDPKYKDKELIDKFNKLKPKSIKQIKNYKGQLIDIEQDFDPYRFSIGNFDKIRILKASSNAKRRRYWEAVLITKLKPITQTTGMDKYYTIAAKQREGYKKINNCLKNNVEIFIKESLKKRKTKYMFQIIDAYHNLKLLNDEEKYEKKKAKISITERDFTRNELDSK